MCMCEKPNINGEFGYVWNDKSRVGIYPINPPTLKDGEEILFDEPGRCGGQDSHSFHYRITSSHALLVRHGGGEERIEYLSNSKALIDAMRFLGSNDRYWILNSIYHAQKGAEQKAIMRQNDLWEKAAVEKRIKTRKLRGSGRVEVWIKE